MLPRLGVGLIADLSNCLPLGMQRALRDLRPELSDPVVRPHLMIDNDDDARIHPLVMRAFRNMTFEAEADHRGQGDD